jgi:hypothetical protein
MPNTAHGKLPEYGTGSIERDVPDAGKFVPAHLQETAKISLRAMRDIGEIHWVQSYVTDDKIYCVYTAPDEETVRRHAKLSGLPANRISRIRSIADATTAE